MKDPKHEALGIRLKASGNISTLALIWLFSALIGYVMQLLQVQSSIISAVLFFANIATYVLTFIAFKNENQAERLEFEKKNGLLKILGILVIPFFIITFASSLFGEVVMAYLNGMIGAETDETLIATGILYVNKMKYLTSLISNIFHNLNLVALFSIKIYLDENRDKRLRSFSLSTAIAAGLHFLCVIIKYIILLNSPTNTGSDFFNMLATITVYVSYFAIFFLFESRKSALKNDISDISKADSVFEDDIEDDIAGD